MSILGKETPHDLLVSDLVYSMTMTSGIQGNIIAAPEVFLEDQRFDAVAVDASSVRPYASVFEIKVSVADAKTWLRAKKWELALKHGATPVLAIPESLPISYDDVPREVKIFRKLDSGRWDPTHHAFPYSTASPSAKLCIGLLQALRRHAWCSGHITSLGESLSAALVRLGEEKAS